MNEGTNFEVKFKNSVTGLTKLESYEKRLNSLKEILKSMPNAIKLDDKSSVGKTTKDIENLTKGLDKTKKVVSTLGFAGLVKGFKEATASLSNYTSKVADYVENLNLMNVAFHRTQDSMDEASLAGTKLVNSLSEMYGMDESNLTRTVGIFKQLANAMNISDEVGTKLSKTLTQLTIDTSSLFNLSFERSSSVLQSALAGQTKPVRSAFGADITETTLQVTLDSYGIDTTVRELSYAEKRLIIVTSLLNQLTEAQNDAGRTISSVANQMRIFNEQTQRLSRAIGSVFIVSLQAILPYLNAILMVLTEVISAFAIFVGFEEDMFAGFATGDLTADIWEMDDALGSAGESAKKLKQGLRGFDKLNVISTPSSGGTGGGASGGGLGVDPDILNAFNKATEDYEKRLEKIKMKATDIRDRIMDWLGFTRLVDEETGKVSFKFEKITGGTVLGAMAVGGIIFKGIKSIFNLMKKIGLVKFDNFSKVMSNDKIKGVVTKFGQLKDLVVGVVQAGAGLFILTDSIRDINENGFGLLNTIGLISGALMSISGIFNTITTAAKLFGITMSSSMAVATGGISLAVTLLAGFVSAISNSAKESDKVAKEMEKINEKYKQLDETAKNNADTQLAQTTRTKELIGELKNLVDENGRVKAGYEDRTNYILKYTNEALGTEYELVGNVIKQNGKVIKSYEEIQKETQKIMKLRKAEIILEAYKDKYVELLKDEISAKEQVATKQMLLNSKMSEYEQRIKNGEDANSKAMKTLKREIGDLALEYENQQIILDTYRKDIMEYEKLQEMYITGSVDNVNQAIKDVMNETKVVLKKASDDIKYDFDKKFSSFNPQIAVGVTEQPSFKNFENKTKNMSATLKVDANTTEAQRKINNLSSSMATSFKVAINYDKKYSKIDISGVSKNAKGGMPPVGQLFIANEKGPELVGQIGGQSFVANQNQMMDLLDKKIGNAQGNKGINSATFVIQVGSEEIARTVLNDLNDMAIANGSEIVIGG